MDNFYDVNDFFAFVLRKKKSFIALVLLIAIAFAGFRFVKNWKSYKAQTVSTQTTSDTTDSTNGEPMWTLVMYPVTASATEEGETAISKFYAVSYDEKILNDVYDQWFEKEQEEDVKRKSLFNQYGYILDKEKGYPYEKYDFYLQFMINGMDLNALLSRNPTFNNNCNMIWIGFKSTDEQLARDIAKNYLDLTMKEASKEGITGIEVQNPTISYQLPGTSSGASSTRTGGTGESSQTVSSKTAVLKQTIKGGIWGGMMGILLSIILLFFSYMMSQKMWLVRDFEKTGLPILGFTFAKKKGTNSLKAGAYRTLEGYHWDSVENRHRISNKIRNAMAEQDVQGEVLVYGTCASDVITSIVESLNREMENNIFVPSEEIPAAAGKPVVVVERIAESLKKEVRGEIEQLREAHAEVLGIVGVE